MSTFWAARARPNAHIDPMVGFGGTPHRPWRGSSSLLSGDNILSRVDRSGQWCGATGGDRRRIRTANRARVEHGRGQRY